MDTQAIRKKILDLALRGKLTEQLPEDGTAEELFQRIQQEKSIQKKAGKRKKDEPDAASAQRDIPFDLPSSWMWVEIGEIFTLQAGKNITADRIADKQSDLYSYPCYGGNGLRGFVEHYNTSGLHALIGRQGALCGNINFAEGNFYATEHAVVVDVYAETDIIWAGLFLKALNLNQYATSVAQPGLAVNRIEKVLIPLPPISEQKRIVEKIESSYSILDTIDTLQSQYQDNLATLKSKIIDAGIQGRLTEQIPEDGNAEELYQQTQQEKLALEKAGKIKKSKPLPPISDEEKPFDILENWKWVRLDDVVKTIDTGKSIKCNEAVPTNDQPGIIRVSAVTWGTFNENESKTCLSENDWHSEYQILRNDFLVSRANTVKLIAACVIVEKIAKRLMLSDKILRLSFASNIDLHYMLFALRSNTARAQIESKATGTSDSMRNISQGDLRSIIIPLPPLAEQKRIVEKLEELLPLCEG